MTTNHGLVEQIEQLVRNHIEATRTAAAVALERAFATAPRAGDRPTTGAERPATAKADYDAKQKLADANNLPDAERKAIAAAVPAQKTAVTAAATVAAAAAAKYTPKDATDSDAYRTAVDEVTTGIDIYVTSTSSGTMDDSALDPLEATVKKLVAARDAAAAALRKAAAANPALTDFAPVSSAQDAWYEAARSQAHVSTRSKLVQDSSTW